MRFSVLGELALFDDEGRPIELHRPKLRLMVLALLAAPGHVLSSAALADVVWSGRPSPSSPGSLRSLVHHVRRRLGESRLVTKTGAYALLVEEGELDADEFETIIDSARAEPEAARALSLYARALSMWRGEAFAGLVQDETERLNEIRLAAMEERFAIELRAGEGAELVPDLMKLVAEHPLHEGFRAQLMLGLYRSRRASDALEVYRQGRGLLLEELGSVPGDVLRRLEHAILTQDPTLWATPASTPMTSGAARPYHPVPAELPGHLQTFVGRAAELACLEGVLTGEHGVVAMDGPGGVGKSALAVHAARLAALRYPDGTLYADLYGTTPGRVPLEPLQVVGRFLRSLGDAPDEIPMDLEKAVERFRMLTAERRLLVVLDNVASADQVAALLPTGPRCAALVTSRRPMSKLPTDIRLHLDVLDIDDAVRLLGGHVGRDRLNAEPDTCQEILRLCGLLPLAVRIVGARLAARPERTLRSEADRLRDAHRPLGELAFADLSVRAAFEVGSSVLAPDDLELFGLIGMLDVPEISVSVAGALADVSEEAAAAMMSRLADTQLVQRSPAGRYGLHDLLRLFAREKVSQVLSEPEQADAIERALHCYLATTRNAMVVLNPIALGRGWDRCPPRELAHLGLPVEDSAAAAIWFDTERNVLPGIARQALDMGLDTEGYVAALASAAFPLEDRGHYPQQIAVQRTAVEAAMVNDDPWSLARAYADLGGAIADIGPFDEAVEHLERSLTLWDGLEDLRQQASVLNTLGSAHSIMGEHERAAEGFARGIEIRERLGVGGRGPLSANLGHLYRRMRRLDEALEAYRRAVPLERADHSIAGEGIALIGAAETIRLMGKAPEAVEEFEAALAIVKRGGRRYDEAEALWNLGRALHDLGRSAEARRRWRESLDLLLELGDVSADQRAFILSRPAPDVPATIMRNMGY